MMPILAGDRRGKTHNVARFRPAGDELEADGREVVALVNDQVTVVADDVAHLTVAYEALDQSNVDAPGRLALAAADGADVAIFGRQEGLQSLAPLIDEWRR